MGRACYIYRHVPVVAVLLGAFAAIFPVSSYAAIEAKAQMPACKVSLKSISVSVGRPGETFEMRGDFEDVQGPKTAVINMGGTHRLEVQSWSKGALTVRIPQGLSPGLYRVGVYCNNPPHWQGSGFMDFRVLAGGSGATGAQEGIKETNDRPVVSSGSNDKGVLVQVGRVPVDDDFLSANLYDYIVALVIAVFLVFVVFVVLRRRNRAVDFTNFDGGGKADYLAAQYQAAAAAQTGANDNNDFKPWAGVYKGVSYTVESLGYRPVKGSDGKTRNEQVLTAWIALDKKLSRPFEINGFDKATKLPDAERGRHIMELIKAGVDYIDVGYNTDWVAAEVLATKFKTDRALVEKIVEELIALKSLSK